MGMPLSAAGERSSAFLHPLGHRFLLRIAGITIEVSADSSINALGVRGAKQKFIVADGLPDVKVTASVQELPRTLPGDKLFAVGEVWQLFRSGDGYTYSFISSDSGSKPVNLALFNHDFTEGSVQFSPGFLAEGDIVDPLGGPLDELLFGQLLARGRGVEVHGCGLVDADGRGRLFIGVSGAGKTTMARLWEELPGVAILSDDRIILRRQGGRIVMHGTPWHGEGGQAVAASAALTDIYFLNKSHENSMVPLADAVAVSRLFACSFVPFYSREALDFTVDFHTVLVQELPCRELGVLPDRKIIDFISRN